MSNDLLFSILPRQGKVPMAHDEQKVQQVSKLAKSRALSDEEKELHDEERVVHEKYQAKKDNQNQTKQENKSKPKQESVEENSKNEDAELADEEDKKKGPKHLDIYV